MPELTDRLPGEVIFASFSNQLIRRSLQRYADRTARDNENPVPETGDMAYITTLGITEVYNGIVWDVLADNTDVAALSARLDVWENKLSTPFNEGPTGFNYSTPWVELGGLTAPVPGDYLFTTSGVGDFDFPTGFESSSAAPGFQMRFLKDAATYLFVSTSLMTTAPKESGFNMAWHLPVPGMLAGEEITWEVRSLNANTSNRFVSEYQMLGEQWPSGILQGLP